MTDNQILDLIRMGHDASEIAEVMVDRDVSGGEYEGCSSELEIAFGEYVARVRKVARHNALTLGAFDIDGDPVVCSCGGVFVTDDRCIGCNRPLV